MSDQRKEYTVTIDGLPHTMLLSQADAEKYGDRAAEVKPVRGKGKQDNDKQGK